MMKKFLSLLLATVMLVSALFTLAGCGKKDAEIRIYLGDQIYDFDPALAFVDDNVSRVMSLIFEPLFLLDENGKVKGGLAEDYEIIEDEEKISRFIELELSHEGYETDKAADGRTGLEKAQSGTFDLIILDIMLPGFSGIEVLRRLRKGESIGNDESARRKNAAKNTPVILLTARDSISDKVTGLDMGANDYITKPYAIEELLARIRVLLRNRVTADEGDEDGYEILTASGIRLDERSHDVTYFGQPVEITNREFMLLKTLIENKDTAMSREKLLQEAWGYDFYGETNIIDVYVRYIRHKTSPDAIKTIRGVGYMITTD